MSLPHDNYGQDHCTDDAFRVKTCSKKPSKSVRASLVMSVNLEVGLT